METMYKVRDDFMLMRIADENVVVARGPYALEFGGVLVLNDSCELLWNKMADFCTLKELADELIRVYNIEENTAEHDVEKFLSKMQQFELLVKQ